MLLKRRSVPARVSEQPSLPLGDPNWYERIVGFVEPGTTPEARSPLQTTVQPVSPRMIRAADEPATRRLAYLGEQVPAVAAHVVEGPQVAPLVPHEKRRLATERHRTTVTRTAQVLRTAHAHPALVEEVLHLPGEHIIVGVSLGRQAHLPLGDHRQG